ncbi:cysteine desulfurase family protein [Aureimonas populi]|uniref:Cysteine desulfurase n=1 Tax=Aureimonas populi TaxID=1701758 RepID=A0ABW5CM58_9HYPH|nr:cysteine desulfurase family protein [Aureimonas populi]
MTAQTRFYFDHNASAPLVPEARAALVSALTAGNPSSVHREGRGVRALVEDAREAIAGLVHAAPDGVVFTSGASEAANAALVPLWHRDGMPVAISRLAVLETDHPCTQEGGRFEPAAITRLPVDRDGRLLPEALTRWLEAAGGQTSMLAITLANNESGVIQPIEPIRAALAGRDVVFVADAVQAAGRRPLDIAALGADAVILSGHKIGAVMGVGALVLRDAAFAPLPLVRGGGQERRHRAGTEAVPAIASFAAAARLAARRSKGEIERLRSLRARLESALEARGAVIIGSGAERLANTIFVTAPGLRAETAQIALDLKGFAVSAGSACASGKVASSPVLAAHARAGLPIDPSLGAVRISFGFETTEAEIDAMEAAIAPLIERAAASQAVLHDA